MNYRADKITDIVGGKWLNKPAPGDEIHFLLVDSRQLQNPARSLFFALKGSRQDGHTFIADLYVKGVRNFLVSQHVDVDQISEANIILVDDVLAALQSIAAFHRRNFDLPVIAITGSNGKTVVKEWLFQLLHFDHHIVKSPR
ncbi:MAG: bifunctional UDP-N-acetylmuramoyl-tripeptide:D-alanyl-D-alanine ligase/alanine racemase, partial [Saprospiraceae bacterium]|nr:bifunctional UDP-N-acetylmuramoyl-tripeptide:D-alanyl-D-alanine ligase/alanine racemase [Saprospiraceae bacterium]